MNMKNNMGCKAPIEEVEFLLIVRMLWFLVFYRIIVKHKNNLNPRTMQAQKYPIKEWSKDDRPREKLLAKGASSLSNSELLAILIINGIREKSALDLAKDVLRAGKDSLNEVGKMSIRELMKLRGIGQAKAVMIMAALELGRRRQALLGREKAVVSSSLDVAGYLQVLLRDYKHEVFAVLFLNRSNRVNHFQIISEGGITGTVADPRIIMKKALEEDAVSMILCHNHP